MIQTTNLSDVIGINVTAGRFTVTSRQPKFLSPQVAHLIQATLNDMYSNTSGAANTYVNSSFHTSPSILHNLPGTEPEPASHGQERRLLSISDIAHSIEQNVLEAHQTHQGYAAQISNVFSYNYPDLSNEHTRQWMENWPPTLGTGGLEDGDGQSCKPLDDTLRVLSYAVGNATLFYQANSAFPTGSLRNSYPKLKDSAESDTVFQSNVDRRDSRSDDLVRFIMWVTEATAEWLGFRAAFFYDLFYTLTEEISDQLVCDLEAVQTCSKWRVSLVNGIFVVGSWFFVWFLVCNALRLQLLAALSLPLFYVMLMRLCYGYAWTCFPLVPTCLLEDVYTSIQRFFPPMILIPAPLWRSAECADKAEITPNCLKTCQDAPFSYTSMQTVVAWILAELGSAVSTFVIDWAGKIPGVDVPQLRINVMVRAKALDDESHDLVMAHRLCAAIGSYRLVPYLVLLMLALVALTVVVQGLSTYIFSGFMIVGSVLVASFTD